MKRMNRIVRMTAAVTLLLSLCVSAASAACVGVGTVTASALRLRAKDSTDSEILATAYEGEFVAVLEDMGNDWYRVDYNSIEGYMSAEYLTVVTEAETDLGYGQVNVSSVLNVRTGPGTEYEKQDTLDNCEVVKVNGIENGWYHIAYGDGKTGYASSEYIELCKDENGNRADDGSYVSSSLQAQIVAYAKQFVGVPYVYGGNGPKCFDCSGFTKYVYAHFGYEINRTASYQLDNGVSVSKDKLQPGDLVFFRRPNEAAKFRASHVGIYLGNDKFINASSNTMTVVIETLSSKKNYIGARRII